MKKIAIISAALLLMQAHCLYAQAEVPQWDLEKGFAAPPQSVKTGIYWYWLSGNISKEGIVKDLHSMKDVGINRVFIGDIRTGTPGAVLFQSEEWWDIMHTALKTAADLDIEVGIFNSPGWSQSGGPWIEPEEAMRYLASSQTIVKGPGKVAVTLEKPAEIFQDVSVIAYPSPKAETSVSESPKRIGNGGYAYDFEFPEGFTARSATVYVPRYRFYTDAVVQVLEEGVYRDVASFTIDRAEPNITVGFSPYGPGVVSFEATAGRNFRVILKNDDQAAAGAKVELSSAPRVENYIEKTFGKMFQYLQPMWSDYMWRKPVPVDDMSLVVDPASVKDISEWMQPDGTLNWDVPNGEWVVLRTGMTPTGTMNGPATPEATGLEVDKMSKKHLRKHFDSYIRKLMDRIPAEDRRTFRILIADSYEMGGENYTDDFRRIFMERYGYDMLPYLPSYYGTVVGSPEMTERFLWDMRRLVADEISYEYVGGLREICDENGLKVWLENYGHWGFPGESLQYGGQSHMVGGEFWCAEPWNNLGKLGRTEIRMASSCAHIYGQPTVSAESFTSGDQTYGRHPAVLKMTADKYFTEGVNDNILHLFISQPFEDKYPGMNDWYGTEFNRHNTWFAQSGAFVNYIKRVGYMLQQGLNVADVAYFIGEDTPKMDGVQHPPLPKGYQFDFINAEVILRDLYVSEGMLTLPHGTQYRVLALPPMETMRPEVLEKIVRLVEDGAVVVGAPPKRSPSLENYPDADEKLLKLAAQLWRGVDENDRKSAGFGKGFIVNDVSLSQILELVGCVPDCRIPAEIPFLFNHRSLADGTELYFLSNQSSDTYRAVLEFRVDGKQPELWDPVTGRTRKLPSFSNGNSVTSVPVKLDPAGSCFIVFRKAGKPVSADSFEANYPSPARTHEVSGPWHVSFEGAAGAPEPVTMHKLYDWTTSDNDGLKYFSGTATYTASFDMGKPAGAVHLDLNRLTAMADVWVNGVYVGCVWTDPYRVDISTAVKKGKNTIAVKVANNWMNRMIGDKRLPESQRTLFSPYDPYNAESQLQESGLIGPVVVEEYVRAQ